ncbi:MAG: RepB family plasmid replication initiator protein [Rhodocyclaceae bacterium]|nr:MAG: RepB family plasmid replication initiator protein [Rhodocyclaceae bacterium]
MPRKKTTDEQSQIALFQAPEVPNAFRKPVQVIHSKPKTSLSLLHRKLGNAWLKNASDTPSDDGWWTIHTATMATDIGFDSNNRAYLIDSARALMGIIFEWDVIAPEGKRKLWKASVLFPEVEIRPDTIRYQISRPLREQVLTPEMYAMIDLNVLKRFRRASSLALYEHCLRFEKIHRTTEVEWQLLRDMLMGESADAKSYQEYKVFKDKVLKVAIAEVNALSDIEIELIEKKLGRRVQTLAFNVRKEREHVPEQIDHDENVLDIGEMVKIGILQSEARQLVKKYSHQQIVSAISYTKKRLTDKKSSKIENPAAYLRKALSNGWAIVDSIEPKQRATTANQEKKPDLIEMYRVEMIREAEDYFRELNSADQTELVSEYNATDISPTLKVKKSKPGKAVRTEFFKWLAKRTWGDPKPEDLLQYAQKLIETTSNSAKN